MLWKVKFFRNFFVLFLYRNKGVGSGTRERTKGREIERIKGREIGRIKGREIGRECI